MGTESNTGAPTESAQRNVTPEDAMSSANVGDLPSSGPQTDSATPSPSPAPVTSDGSAPAPKAGDGSSPPKKKKHRGPLRPRFDAEPALKEGRSAVARADGIEADLVKSDGQQVSYFVGQLDRASSVLATALGRKKVAGEALDHADRSIGPAAGSVFWLIRLQPGGPKFLNDRQGPTTIETAQSVLAALPESSFTVPAPLLDALRAELGPASTVLATFKKRKEEAAAAKKAFMQAKRGLAAAIKVLNRSIDREKFAAEVPEVQGSGAKEKRSRKKGA